MSAEVVIADGRNNMRFRVEYMVLVSKPIACMLGGGKAPRLSEVHCDRDSVCVKTDTRDPG